jgi:hypothetical protein
MNQHGQNQAINDPSEVGFWAKIFKSRCLLTYQMGNNQIQVYVTEFKEKSDNCISYRDYVTDQVTVVKNDQPIIYTLVVEK